MTIVLKGMGRLIENIARAPGREASLGYRERAVLH
jgi:hypothetical protein